MENPIKNGMIWGEKPPFQKTPTYIPGSSRYNILHGFIVSLGGVIQVLTPKTVMKCPRTRCHRLKHSGSAYCWMMINLLYNKWVKLVTTNLLKMMVGYVYDMYIHLLGYTIIFPRFKSFLPTPNPGEGWPSGLMQSSLPETHLPPSLLSLCVPWTPDFLSKKR